MANIDDSIEQLTASLQELKTQSYTRSSTPEAGPVALDELKVSQEVDSFLETVRRYAEKTRNVSKGEY